MRLADQQNAMIKKMNFLQEKIESLKENRKNAQVVASQKENRIEERMKEYENKLKNVLADKQRESKKLQQCSQQLENLTNETDRQDFINCHERNRIANDQKIEEIILNDRKNQIAALNAQIVRVCLCRNISKRRWKATKNFKGQRKIKTLSRKTWQKFAKILQVLNLNCFRSTSRSNWLKMKRKSMCQKERNTWRNTNL